ncbi:MAG: mannosylglycerate synthase domain-containing protein [Acidimicrobiia bacterium]
MADGPSSRARGGPRTLVVIPVLNEDINVVMANIGAAATHSAVAMVLTVTGDHAPTNRAIASGVKTIPGRISVIPQRRLGVLRAGKGDAVNTGLQAFLEETDFARIHFYDADIKTFDGLWITKAEAALDRGFSAVRHFYPRAATDAMITWMITRPGFAVLWPDSLLPWLEQPLSGELAFTREGAEEIASDPGVVAQSDWGIDTAITVATVSRGLSIYESYIARGKDHALYGSLTDIKDMMVECLAALQRLQRAPSIESHVRHEREPADSVSESIVEQIGYDVEATQHLLGTNWTPGQERILQRHFPGDVAGRVRDWKRWPDTTWMTETVWLATLETLIHEFDASNDDWRAVATRLWIGRVLHYTLRVAVRGHAFADRYLHDTVSRAIAWAHERPSRTVDDS